MKVLMHYEDNENSDLFKSLKITLPKSWKSGPTEKLLGQFIETYNGNDKLGGGPNPLDSKTMHLAIRDDSSSMVQLASDAVVLDVIPDRADIYVQHGPSQTLEEIQQAKQQELIRKRQELASTVACTRFGCKKRFPRGGPYPDCQYHKSPPVFHETAKFWSCCPNKKAYDWDSFENIPGCQTGTCTEMKEDDGQKQFLGGSDLREQAGATKLKSIDDFNRSQAAGGADAAPVLDRLQNVLSEFGIEKELYEQVLDGIKKDLQTQALNEAELFEGIKKEFGVKLKATLKSMAAEQLRIK